MVALAWCAYSASTLSSDASEVRPTAVKSAMQVRDDVPSSGGACMTSFPYSVDEFMRNLMLVADEPNPWKVRQKFEEAFKTKFSHFHRYDTGHKSSQWIKMDCEWYAVVSVSINNTEANRTYARSMVEIRANSIADIKANRESVLEFAQADNVVCLTPETMTRLLRADGWGGGVAYFEASVSLAYQKPDVAIEATLGGPPNPGDRATCVSYIKIRFTNPN